MAKNLTPNPFPWWEGELDGTARKIGALPRIVAVGVVAIYRAAVSPVIHAINGPACRFEPSCSEYARDAIAMHGMVRGGAMAIWRIARCNPVGGHGFDPVPATTGRILSRAPTTRALIGPSPSSSPLQGEGTEPSPSRLTGEKTA